jgi:hypothetical protein
VQLPEKIACCFGKGEVVNIDIATKDCHGLG